MKGTLDTLSKIHPPAQTFPIPSLRGHDNSLLCILVGLNLEFDEDGDFCLFARA